MAYGARLESVLGASPRGFESPILRFVNNARRMPGVIHNTKGTWGIRARESLGVKKMPLWGIFSPKREKSKISSGRDFAQQKRGIPHPPHFENPGFRPDFQH